MERSQKKIHRKDELTWPAHILTCSPHVLALNGISLLAVTCPCKNQAGWPFWCPYRNVVFFGLEPCTGRPTLKSHRSKVGLRATSSDAIIKHRHARRVRVIFLWTTSLGDRSIRGIVYSNDSVDLRGFFGCDVQQERNWEFMMYIRCYIGNGKITK